MSMEEEAGRGLERRIGHLEREMAAHSVLLARNTEILDEIRGYMNKPTNWAEWLMAALASASAVGGLIWAFFVQPLELQVQVVDEHSKETRAYLRDVGEYAKETRSVLDRHLDRSFEPDKLQRTD